MASLSTVKCRFYIDNIIIVTTAIFIKTQPKISAIYQFPSLAREWMGGRESKLVEQKLEMKLVMNGRKVPREE